MGEKHVTTTRIDSETYDTLSVVASATGNSVNSSINEAITEYLDRQLADPEIQTQLGESYARHQAVMERMKQ